MVVRAIFFDFDGTISDSKSLAFKTMVRVFDEFNCTINKSKALKLMGVKTMIVFKELGLNPGHIAEAYRKFNEYFDRGAKDGEIKPCCSLKPLWKLSKDFPLIIISNSKRSFLKRSLRTLKIKKMFKGGYYGEDDFSTKDEMLTKLFKKMKILPHEAIYVGDRFSDIEYAREAGCFTVAIHNECSWSDLSTIKSERPDFLIKDFEGLVKIVDALNTDYYR